LTVVLSLSSFLPPDLHPPRSYLYSRLVATHSLPSHRTHTTPFFSPDAAPLSTTAMAPSFFQVLSSLAVAITAFSAVNAESHTISFENKCGRGTPTLIVGGKAVSAGQPFTSDTTISGIAYLQTGGCLFNGEGCTLMEFTLNNPSCPGCGSSADISLIPPHAFNVETSYSFYNGCDGQGNICSSSTCNTAFFKPDDNQVQTGCQANNVNLRITFCESAGAAEPPAPSTSVHVATSSAPAVASPEPPKNVAPPPPSEPSATVVTSHSAPTAPPSLPTATPVPSKSSSSATSVAPSPSASVNRSSCKAKGSNIGARQARAAAEHEARDLYSRHSRRLSRRRADSFGGSL
jgi:hypothetical protein